MTDLFCINCFMSVSRVQKFHLKDSEEIDRVIRRWTTVLNEIPVDDAIVCRECWYIAKDNIDVPDAKQQLGHQSVCIWCGSSVLRKNLKDVWKEDDLLKDIREYLTKAVYPRPFTKDSKICRACYQRAYRKHPSHPKYRKITEPVELTDVTGQDTSVDGEDTDVTGQDTIVGGENTDFISEDTIFGGENTDVIGEDDPSRQESIFIKLSDYIRAAEVSNKCFVEACNVTKVETPSLFMRQSLLKQCNFYIPKTCLVCARHKTDWDFMAQPMEEIHVFKPEHVAGMLQLMAAKC